MMREPAPRRRRTDGPATSNRRRQRVGADIGEAVGTALLALLLASLLTGAVGLLSLLDDVRFGPSLGTVLTFGPYGANPPGWQVEAVRVSDHRRCILRPAVMGAGPGSMVVDQRLADGPTFRAHWAGGPTSDGRSDCGSGVDVTISLPAMQTLVDGAAAASHWYLVGT